MCDVEHLFINCVCHLYIFPLLFPSYLPYSLLLFLTFVQKPLFFFLATCKIYVPRSEALFCHCGFFDNFSVFCESSLCLPVLSNTWHAWSHFSPEVLLNGRCFPSQNLSTIRVSEGGVAVCLVLHCCFLIIHCSSSLKKSTSRLKFHIVSHAVLYLSLL